MAPPPPPPPMASAMAPSAEPPLAMAPATASVGVPTPAAVRGGLNVSTPTACVTDELAGFAMQCALAEKQDAAVHADRFATPNCFATSDLWSPLRFNGMTGKLETRGGHHWPSEHERMSNGAADAMDSPIEPGLTKREVSFSTQMVRRAVSFILSDSLDDPASPLLEARKNAHSPHTAIAA